MVVALRRIILVAQTQREREPLQDLPGVLPVERVGIGPNAVDGVRELIVIVPETADEIGELVASEISVRKIEAAVIKIVVIEVVAHMGEIPAEFPFVLAMRPRNAIGPAIDHIRACRRTLRRRPQIERIREDDRRRGSLWVIWIDVRESEVGRGGLVRWVRS